MSREYELKAAIQGALMKDGGYVDDDDMADGILAAVLGCETGFVRSEGEAILHLASALGVRIKRGSLESYPSQENVEVREEEGHPYLHVRSTQPAGVVALSLYEALLKAAQAGYEVEAPQPASGRISQWHGRAQGPF